MSDIVQITAGSGISISTDEVTIDSVAQHVQRVKIGLGANNAWDMDLDSGQQTMANSVPVVIASDQSTINVAGSGITTIAQAIYAEDSAHVSGDKGIFSLAVVGDGSTQLAVVGDYSPFAVDIKGRQYVICEDATAFQATAKVLFNGAAPLCGNGGTGTGSLRVTIANDTTAIPVASHNVTNAGTFVTQIDGAALTALQVIDNMVSGTGANISQINGVTPLMGNGATGTGSLRVTIANDNTAVPVATHGVTQSGVWNVAVTNADLSTLAGAVSATHMQADVLTVPAPLSTTGNGTAATALRVTLANDSTGTVIVEPGAGALNISGEVTFPSTQPVEIIMGSVDVSSVIPGTAATSLGKAEDAVHATGATGVMVLSVSSATASGLAGSPGDYQPLLTSSVNGRLYATALIDSALPAGTNGIGKLTTNPGVVIGDVNVVSMITGSGTTNLGKAEDNVALSGDIGVAALAVRRDSPSGDVSNAGDYATLQVNSTGSLWVVPTTAILDNAGFTDGTTPVEMAGFIFDETAGTGLTENDVAAARVDIKRAVVNVLEDATTRGQRAAVTARGALYVEGPIAHDATSTANPILMGGYAITAEQTAVVNTDLVRFVADLTGKQIVLPYANPENYIAGVNASGVTAMTNTLNTQIIAAQGGSLRIFVTSLLVTNAHATVGTIVNIKDGTTTVHTGYAAAAGGGFSLSLPTPLRLTANTALNAACVTSGSSIWVSAAGYKGI